MSASKSANSRSLRAALAERVVIADGAMGTMIQAADPSLDDFQGHEGCNEILNITRPEVIAAIHRQYLQVGVDAIETNTFGANLGNLAEYGIPIESMSWQKLAQESRALQQMSLSREMANHGGC